MFPGSFSEASFLASNPFLIDFWIPAGHDWLPKWPSGRIPGSPEGLGFFGAIVLERPGAPWLPKERFWAEIDDMSIQKFIKNLISQGEIHTLLGGASIVAWSRLPLINAGVA